MGPALNELNDILSKMDDLSKQMAREELALTAERQDRIDKGITEHKAVMQHYNDWMQRAGLQHLMCNENK